MTNTQKLTDAMRQAAELVEFLGTAAGYALDYADAITEAHELSQAESTAAMIREIQHVEKRFPKVRATCYAFAMAKMVETSLKEFAEVLALAET